MSEKPFVPYYMPLGMSYEEFVFERNAALCRLEDWEQEQLEQEMLEQEMDKQKELNNE